LRPLAGDLFEGALQRFVIGVADDKFELDEKG
jgi:hypothetical protein